MNYDGGFEDQYHFCLNYPYTADYKDHHERKILNKPRFDWEESC